MNHGVVTLLDVLGWKGIWQRYAGNESEPLNKLQTLVKVAHEFLAGWMRGYCEGRDSSAYYFQVTCISDTILLASWTTKEGEEAVAFQKRALDHHAKSVAALIRYSILMSIPFRGATAAGGFLIEGNSFIGPAIDEVASWYEQADWIGVIFTPSAKMLRPPLSQIVDYNAPLKQGVYRTPCVNWPAYWMNNNWHQVIWGSVLPEDIDTTPKTRADLLSSFLAIGPMTLGIHSKYENALKFFDEFTPTPTPAV